MRHRFAGLIIVALANGCAGGDPSQTLAPRLEDLNRRFEYRAYDPGGRLLLAGTLTIASYADSTLTGTWEIAWAPGADTSVVVGPQVGTGTLSGRYDGAHTTVDLNPGWADNNVFLHAPTARGSLLTGEWQYSTLIGPVAAGPFELR